MRVLFITLLIMMLGLPQASFAQSKKELAAQNIALAERIQRLENRMLTGDPAAERLTQRIDALETSQRNLRGEVETLRFERDNYKAEFDALTEDLREMQAVFNRMKIHLDAVDVVAQETQAARNNALNQSLSSGATGGLGNAYGQSNPLPFSTAPELRDYDPAASSNQTGSNQASSNQAGGSFVIANDQSKLGEIGKVKLAEGDFSGAQSAFSQYLQFNPEAKDAGEINYWLGESYFVRGGYADAADAYIASMRLAPQGVKAAEAMVRLGASLRELGQVKAACQTLGSFKGQYPNAPVTVKEKAQLEAARTGC